MVQHLNRLFWIPVAAIVMALVWMVYVEGRAAGGSHLFATPDAATEAGYCLAVAERARELTHGQGELRLEAFLTESIDFWRSRVESSAVAGRAALERDLAVPGVNEGAHLHLAVQDCGQRAVGLYGHRFQSMPGA